VRPSVQAARARACARRRRAACVPDPGDVGSSRGHGTWFERFEGAGLDGVVAKPIGLGYREGERVMWEGQA